MAPRKQFCPRGHDTFAVGRNKNGDCLACIPLRNAEYREKHSDALAAAKREQRLRSLASYKARDAAYHQAHKEARSAYKKRWVAENREHVRGKLAEWYRSNKDRVRDATLKKHYGISLYDVRVMLEGQGGGCAICSTKEPKGRGFHVDHDHDTGKVRGILCGNCNTAIGKLRDDPSVAMRAADYLKLHHKERLTLVS